MTDFCVSPGHEAQNNRRQNKQSEAAVQKSPQPWCTRGLRNWFVFLLNAHILTLSMANWCSLPSEARTVEWVLRLVDSIAMNRVNILVVSPSPDPISSHRSGRVERGVVQWNSPGGAWEDADAQHCAHRWQTAWHLQLNELGSWRPNKLL